MCVCVRAYIVHVCTLYTQDIHVCVYQYTYTYIYYIHTYVCTRYECYLHQNCFHLILQSLFTQKRDKTDSSIWKNFVLRNTPSELDSTHWPNCQCVLVAQSCPTLWDPVDCGPPGSSVRGILQAKILEWAAISFSRRFSRPRDWIQVSLIAGRLFTVWVAMEALIMPETL